MISFKHLFILFTLIGVVILKPFVSISQKNNSFEKTMQVFNNVKSKQVLVAAHRGDWRNAPENSLQGLKNAIEMGVDIVELDLKKTKDGQLIIMHDRTIDRTTNGKGKPEDFTLEEIRKFRLKNGLGRVTTHPIPTFEEMLMAAKGKVIIDVDKGYEYFNDVIKLLKQTAMVKQSIVNIDDDTYLDSIELRFGKVDTSIMLMPIINYNKINAEKILDSYKKYSHTIFQPVFAIDTFSLIKRLPALRNEPAYIWLNSLWPSLNGSHDDDKAIDENQPDETWGWLIEHGANIIQTDRPLQLLRYLKDKGLHS